MSIYFALMYFTFYQYVNAQLHVEYKLGKSNVVAREFYLFSKINKSRSFKNIHARLQNI